MQQKESKTNVHFYFSLTKSILRILACSLFFVDICPMDAGLYFASLFILAELLGIAEEIF